MITEVINKTLENPQIVGYNNILFWCMPLNRIAKNKWIADNLVSWLGIMAISALINCEYPIVNSLQQFFDVRGGGGKQVTYGVEFVVDSTSVTLYYLVVHRVVKREHIFLVKYNHSSSISEYEFHLLGYTQEVWLEIDDTDTCWYDPEYY